MFPCTMRLMVLSQTKHSKQWNHMSNPRSSLIWTFRIFSSMTYARTKGLYPIGIFGEIASILSTLRLMQKHCYLGKMVSNIICVVDRCVASRSSTNQLFVILLQMFGYDYVGDKIGLYTRYADDLTFTSKDSEAPVTVLGLAKHIVEEQFVVHPNKTRTAYWTSSGSINLW